MDEDHIALRELGQKLMVFGPYRDSTSQGRAELLKLLRSAKLIARFDFPSNERPQISVPVAYWRDVKIGEFRKALDSTKRNKGDYIVNPSRFANEYLSWFLQDHRLPEHADELSVALQVGSAEAEVYVLAKDIEQFISQEGLDTTQHSTTPQKSSRGQSENKNWSAILVEVAVELLKANRDSRPDPNVIAANARKQVTAREKTEHPKIDTIRKKVDEIISRVWES
jgi:hypothetical protein